MFVGFLVNEVAAAARRRAFEIAVVV